MVEDRRLGRLVGAGLHRSKLPGMMQQIAAEPGIPCIRSWRMGLGEALAEVGEMAYPSVHPLVEGVEASFAVWAAVIVALEAAKLQALA